jgi:hypothetical protein
MIKQLLSGICVILLFSCNDSVSTAPIRETASGKFNFGILKYDSTALEYRLDSIHNRGLVLQFCLKEAGNNNTAFQLISYAFDTLNDYNNSWIPDTLAIVTDSVPKTFTGRISVGNNEVTREQLLNTVRDQNGKRFSYDYVVFTPVVEGVFYHVVYTMKAFKDNKPTRQGAKQMTSPMPPMRNWN